jgi:hypothetical protein
MPLARSAEIAAALALAALFASPMIAADAAGGAAQSAAGADAAVPEPAAPEAPAPPPYWILEEFDWGDDEEVVAESIAFDPYFGCTGDRMQPCAMVSAVIEQERLLARFNHHGGELWQVVFLTPDLRPDNHHLKRVWQLLADYMTKMKGKPAIAVGFPALDTLAYGAPHLTHFWSLPGLEARVMVGRRDVDAYYVALFLSDPVRGKLAREPFLARLAASDQKQREKRAAGAGKPKKTGAGN